MLREVGDYPEILDQLGYGVPSDLRAIAGGCISRAAVATFKNGMQVFVKWTERSLNPQAGRMFHCEAEGLRALAAAGVIRVPGVLAVGTQGLVLEMVESAPRKQGFFEDFGRRFAALHDCRGKACGFAEDNFIGASVQFNSPLDGPWDRAPEDDGSGWPEFFIERRLRVQVRLAADNGYGHELARLLDRAERRIHDQMSTAIERPSLLHGDLWSGNFIVDESGGACLIDPAVYYGHREVDLAMTRLFGGFGDDFYSAYGESLPLAPGHEERLGAYQLYHVLNHLNLFGGHYFEQGRRLLQFYAR